MNKITPDIFVTVPEQVEKRLFGFADGEKKLEEYNTLCEKMGKDNVDSFTFKLMGSQSWPKVRDGRIEHLRDMINDHIQQLAVMLDEQDIVNESTSMPEQMLEAVTGVSRSVEDSTRSEKMLMKLGELKVMTSELSSYLELRAAQELMTEPVAFEKIEEMLSGWEEKYTPYTSSTMPQEENVIKSQINDIVDCQLKFIDEEIETNTKALEKIAAEPALIPEYVLQMCTGATKQDEVKMKGQKIHDAIADLQQRKARARILLRRRAEEVVDLYLTKTVVKEMISGNLDFKSIPIAEVVTSDSIIKEMINKYKSGVFDLPC